MHCCADRSHRGSILRVATGPNGEVSSSAQGGPKCSWRLGSKRQMLRALWTTVLVCFCSFFLLSIYFLLLFGGDWQIRSLSIFLPFLALSCRSSPIKTDFFSSKTSNRPNSLPPRLPSPSSPRPFQKPSRSSRPSPPMAL